MFFFKLPNEILFYIYKYCNRDTIILLLFICRKLNRQNSIQMFMRDHFITSNVYDKLQTVLYNYVNKLDYNTVIPVVIEKSKQSKWAIITNDYINIDDQMYIFMYNTYYVVYLKENKKIYIASFGNPVYIKFSRKDQFFFVGTHKGQTILYRQAIDKYDIKEERSFNNEMWNLDIHDYLNFGRRTTFIDEYEFFFITDYMERNSGRVVNNENVYFYDVDKMDRFTYSYKDIQLPIVKDGVIVF